ncbi:DUF1178 family protein [Aliiroseovarius sp. PTFE2010]|uniref:DUF1178 family protein n=1 Tax=Aliiroseovarius sp. PTFE2010 TaxID=3417190 RepID=UPI003CECEB70
MIKYALKCSEDHGFESWFKSSDAFDALDASGLLSCPICGSPEVTKAIMAPRLTKAAGADPAQAETEPPAAQSLLTSPSDEVQTAMQRLKAAVEKNSDYVGQAFTSEARAIHEGDAPQRSIYGEAKPEDARKLLEDGVPVLPLPFLPKRKVS